MSKFFTSRNVARKTIPDAVAQIKQNLEQEIEKELAIMTVAMPFLPKDQVRGIVLRKLGLQNGKTKNSFRRTGGGRIDYKKISLEFPLSLDARESTSIESPRTIRKKLLGRSHTFCIVGCPAKARNQPEKDAMNDTFGFTQASPTDQAPRPYERKIQVRRPRKTLKRKLFTITDDENDTLLGGTENIAQVESRPDKPCRRNIFTSTPKKTAAEAAQQLRRNEGAQVRQIVPEPSGTRRPVRHDSEEHIAESGGFTQDSSEDENVASSNPRSGRNETSSPVKSVAESNNEEADRFTQESSEDENVASSNPRSGRNKTSSPVKSVAGSYFGQASRFTQDSSEDENVASSNPQSQRNGTSSPVKSVAESNYEQADRFTQESSEDENVASSNPRSGRNKTSSPVKSVAGSYFGQADCFTQDSSEDENVASSNPQSQRNGTSSPVKSVAESNYEQADSFTQDSSEDENVASPSPEPRQNEAAPPEKVGESSYEEAPMEDNSSPVLNRRNDKGLLWRRGTIARTTTATSKEPVDREALNRTSPTPVNRAPGRDTVYLSNKPTVDKQTERHLNTSSTPRDVNPTPAHGISPVQVRRKNIMEVLESPEEIFDLMDTAVVPEVPSDAASTRITPPEKSEASSTRINLAVSDDSDKIPGGSRNTDKDYHKSPTVVPQKKISPASSRKRFSASQTLRRQIAAFKQHSPGDTFTKSSVFQSRLQLQNKNSILDSSETSAKRNNGHNFSTPDFARADSPRRQCSRSTSITSESAPSSVGLWNVSPETQDHSNVASESEGASAQTKESTLSLSQSTCQEYLRPYRKQGSYGESAAYHSPVRGSSAEIVPSSHESNTHREKSAAAFGSGEMCPGSSIIKKTVMSVNTPGSSSSGSKHTIPDSASQISLNPYRKKRCYNRNTADCSPVRDSSAEIVPPSQESNAQWCKSATAGSGVVSFGSSIQNYQNYDSPKSVVSVNAPGSTSFGSKHITPESASQTSLRPYLKKRCYTTNTADCSPVRSSFAEIVPLSHESNAQWWTSATAGLGEVCFGSSNQNDQKYDSPKSVVSNNTRGSYSDNSNFTTPKSSKWEPSPVSKNTTPEYTNQTTHRKQASSTENTVYFSADQQNLESLTDVSFHSSDFEETPITCFQPRYGSFKKGIPRINQIPDEKMTARRTMFQGKNSGADSDLSQEKNPEHAASQDLFKTSDEVFAEKWDEERFYSKHSLLANPPKQISVVPLLLRRGADRLDGLPFASGEAVRPFSAGWLHQKKLNSQSDSTPSATVKSSRSSGGNRNDWRSDESLVVDMTNSQVPSSQPISSPLFSKDPVVDTTNSQVPPSQPISSPLFSKDPVVDTTNSQVPSSQSISSPLFSKDPFLSNASTLPVAPSQEHSSLRTDKWWNEDTVLNALSQLGMEEFSTTGVISSEMQLTFETGQNSSPNPSLVSQESDAQCSSPESMVKRTL